jgi:class 3 adenylate cyclase
MQTKNLTVMITDIKGYTQRTSSQSRQKTLDLVLKHTKLVQPIILDFHGTAVKTMDNAFLATFESPTNALLAAIDIQKQLEDYNDTVEVSQSIEVRIAINSGEVIVAENDVYGEPVNIAARIESLAKPNEIYFTEAVYLSMNRREVTSSEIGYRILNCLRDSSRTWICMDSKGQRQTGLA